MNAIKKSDYQCPEFIYKTLGMWRMLIERTRNSKLACECNCPCKLITYTELGKPFGIDAPDVAQYIKPIEAYCICNGIPSLSALVVNAGDKLPGKGIDIPGKNMRDPATHKEYVKEVYDYWEK